MSLCKLINTGFQEELLRELVDVRRSFQLQDVQPCATTGDVVTKPKVRTQHDVPTCPGGEAEARCRRETVKLWNTKQRGGIITTNKTWTSRTSSQACNWFYRDKQKQVNIYNEWSVTFRWPCLQSSVFSWWTPRTGSVTPEEQDVLL